MRNRILASGRHSSVAFVLSLLLSGLGLAPAAAHGGTVRVDTDAGPYHIIVATGPGPQAADLLITVVLTTVSTGAEAWQPVTGAEVGAQFQAAGGGGAPVTYPLPPEPTLADAGYYERIVTIPGEGAWQVTVQVQGTAGAASAAFPITWQRPPPWAGWLTWATVLLPVLVVAGVFFYLWRTQRPGPPAPPAPEE